jgi:hypothetical protein
MVIISFEPCSNIAPGRLITLGNFRRALPPKTGYFYSRINTVIQNQTICWLRRTPKIDFPCAGAHLKDLRRQGFRHQGHELLPARYNSCLIVVLKART